MQVLLLTELSGIGHRGEVKEVAEGFARNFLFPQKKAVLASSENLKSWQAEKNKKIKSEQKHQEELIKLAHRLQGVNLEFNEKVDNKGQLFGGISSAHIVSALAQKGLKVEKNQIILERAYKQIGKYSVKIKLAQGVEAEIKIIINKK